MISMMRSGRRLSLAVSLLVAMCLAAGCGSSSSSSSSSASSSGSQSSGQTGKQTAAAKSAEQKYLATATKIDQTVPLKTAPPKGRTVVYLQCGFPQCVTQGAGFAAAAKAAGWNYKSLSYDSANPAQLVSDMQRALQYHPVAVSFTGEPEAVWKSVLPAYQAAHTAIIPINIGPTATVKPPVAAVLFDPKDNQIYANALGNWFIADSGAKGHVLLIDVPGFPILHEFSTAFKHVVSQGCSACKVTTMTVSIPDVQNGSLNSLIVAALRKDPSINYVISSDGTFLDTLPASLSSAGLSGKVKLAGAQGDSVGEHYLSTGQMQAFTGLADNIEAWVAVDAAARYAEGMKLPDTGDGGLPTQLILKSSNLPPANAYDYPTNYPSQFKALWHVQ
jgi:ribose transport system substrate-binding protein